MHAYTTEALALMAGLKPQTLRAALSRKGHWCGIQPIKLPNRLLLWPADRVDAVLFVRLDARAEPVEVPHVS